MDMATLARCKMEKLVKLLPIDLAPKDGSEAVCWCPGLGWRTLY